MPVLRCKMCGGTMEIDAKQSVAVCQYCGTRQTLPRLDSERIAGLYERAELLRRIVAAARRERLLVRVQEAVGGVLGLAGFLLLMGLSEIFKKKKGEDTHAKR